MLHHSLDLVIGSALLELHREVHARHVERGHAERHARELALELGDHQPDGLGRARGRGDDVVVRRAAAAPVLGRGATDRKEKES